MQTLILITLALAALTLALSLRRTPAASAAPSLRPSPARPASGATPVTGASRVVNPRRAGHADVQVWILRASPACELTHAMLDGQRYATEAAPALPGVGCRLEDCRCRYQPLSDTRGGERRQRTDRRHQFRFETRTDRRHRDDRRQNDQWRHAGLR